MLDATKLRSSFIVEVLDRFGATSRKSDDSVMHDTEKLVECLRQDFGVKRDFDLFWLGLWGLQYARCVVCAAAHVDCWFLSGDHNDWVMKSDRESAEALVLEIAIA